MTDWPDEYNDTSKAGNPGMPHWRKDQALTAGRALADAMYAGGSIAENYISIVKKYYASQRKAELKDEYLPCIEDALKAAKAGFTTKDCNANDFANCHRAAWLHVANAFAYLVDKCPHVDGQGNSDWGNPQMIENPTPHRSISRGDEGLVPADAAILSDIFSVHNIPNLSGYFQISTEDIGAAPVSR